MCREDAHGLLAFVAFELSQGLMNGFANEG